jgi:uncharacterized protein
MKFFLVLAAVLIGVWLFRSGRQDKVTRQKPLTPPPGPQEMVSCQSCGVHFPQADAVSGRNGLYCSTEHRQRAES